MKNKTSLEKYRLQRNNGANKKQFKQNGFITAYALIAASVASVLLVSLIIFVSSNQRFSQNEAARQQALWVAENGIYFYKWYLAHNLDGKNIQQVKEFWASGNPYGLDKPYQQEVDNFEAEAIGRYEIEVEPPDPDSTIVYVTATGWTYRHPNIKRSIRVRFRRPSWSEYSVLGNDVMRFGEGTDIYGPVHSNNGIRFDGYANNVVSSSVSQYDDPDHSGGQEFGVHTHVSPTDPLPPSETPERTDVFSAGREFPVPVIDFNGITTDLAYMKEQAGLGGLYFGDETYEVEDCKWRHGNNWCGCSWCWCLVCDTEQYSIQGYHITLRTDDKIEVSKVLDYQGDSGNEPNTYKIMDETEAVIYDMPANGLVFVEGNLWVDGQIDTARITLVAADMDASSEANIYINSSILYTNKDGSDIIGLIAENDISIGLYSDNNLEIDAAMLAQKGRVGRDYYTESQSAQYAKRDSITIFGSIATNERYGFAWTDGTGYNLRNIYFDNNLVYYPPPFFPTGTVYELDLWEEL